MPLGALHVLDDGVARGKTMRSGFISPHPVSFKAGALVTYSHPPPPLPQPRQQPAVGSEPRLQSLTGRSTSSHGGRASWRWKAAEQPSNNLWHLAACNTSSPNAAMAGHAGERIESWTVARCFRCRRARSLDPPSGMLVVAAAIASTTCCRRWKVTIRQNLSHTQSLTSPVWRTWHMIRAKEGRNMPITSKVTPCTQQPVQATETHSRWHHFSLTVISLQTAKSYHSCCDLCLCKYIFMLTLMSFISKVGSQDSAFQQYMHLIKPGPHLCCQPQCYFSFRISHFHFSKSSFTF